MNAKTAGRLNNHEFCELIPYLELEDLFLIQIKYDDWIKVFESIFVNHKEHIRCNLCEDNPVIQIQDFMRHISQQSHNDSLKWVNQFYHPVYTFSKDYESLAKGEASSKEETEGAIVVAENGLRNEPKINIFEAKRLAARIKSCGKSKTIHLHLQDVIQIRCFTGTKKFPLISQTKTSVMRCVLCHKSIYASLNSHFRAKQHIKKLSELKCLVLENNPEVNKNVLIQIQTQTKYVVDYERILTNIVEKATPKKPHLMHIVCSMAHEDLIKIEYLTKTRKWRNMLERQIMGAKKSVTLKCNVCSKTCGIAGISCHLMSKNHRKNQLDVKNLRHIGFPNVTKFWSFTAGGKYDVKVALKARKKYHDLVLNALAKEEKTMNDDSNSVENHQAAMSSIKTDEIEECLEAQDTKDGEKANNDQEEGNSDPSKECDFSELQEVNNYPLEGTYYPGTETIFDEQELSSGNAKLAEIEPTIAAKARALKVSSLKQSRTKAEEINNKITEKNDEEISNEIKLNALVGVEYVVKIMRSQNDLLPKYECCLCEVLLNEQRMHGHLTGYNHRYKYCEMHYPTAFKKYLANLAATKYYDMFRVLGPILGKLAFKIEKYHGRSVPQEVMAQEFEKKRPEIIAQLYCAKHASELYGPSFTNIFSNEEIKQLIADKDSYVTPKLNAKDKTTRRFVKVPSGHMYCNQIVRAENLTRNENQRRSRSQSPASRIKKDRSSKLHVHERLRAISPREYSEENPNIWQKFRQHILISASEVERAYMEYRRYPESHPLYDQEWNRFWKHRKDELISQGIDHRSYNFQTEWVLYFKDRLEELFGEALEQAKVDVRMRLNIPRNAQEDSDSDNQYINVVHPHQKLQDDMQRNTGGATNIPKLMEQKYVHPSTMNKRIDPPSKKQRVDTECLVMQWNSQAKQAQNRQNIRSDSFKRDKQVHFSGGMRASDNKPDLIHVLRLMTAFEDYLGSLGPKITELLYMTLALEKTIPNNTILLEQKVLTPNNCSLLETSMEKLKGILYAGLLDIGKLPGFNQVIRNTEDLLNHADKMGYRNQLPMPQERLFPEINRNPRQSEESSFQHLINFMNSGGGYDDRNSIGNNNFFAGREKSSANSNWKCGNHQEYRDVDFNLKAQHFSNRGENNFQGRQIKSGRNNADIPYQMNGNLNIKSSNFSEATRNQLTNNDVNDVIGSCGSGHFSTPMMGQTNIGLQGFGGRDASNLNMASGIGRSNYNNFNLNNKAKNYANTNINMAETSLGNMNNNNQRTHFQQDSGRRMWNQHNISNNYGGNFSELQQQRQNHQY